MPNRRLSISLRKRDAMRITRIAIGRSKLVYVIVADTKLTYPNGRSKIAYVGTTKNGVTRVAQSAAYRTDAILRRRGVESFRVHIVICRPRKNVKTWVKLERAVLLVFRDLFGAVPICNKHGKNIRATNEFDYFARTRIARILNDLS